MQRSDSALVNRIWVGANPNEPRNDLRLRTRIPCGQARPTINGIVKGLRAASVSCANVRALRLAQLTRIKKIQEKLAELSSDHFNFSSHAVVASVKFLEMLLNEACNAQI
jgi:hypothetical protein